MFPIKTLIHVLQEQNKVFVFNFQTYVQLVKSQIRKIEVHTCISTFKIGRKTSSVLATRSCLVIHIFVETCIHKKISSCRTTPESPYYYYFLFRRHRFYKYSFYRTMNESVHACGRPEMALTLLLLLLALLHYYTMTLLSI